MNLRGAHVLVTGANTGVGRATAEALAQCGAHVLLACSSAERTRPVVDAITGAGGHAEFVALDLADFTSVRACAEGFLARDTPLALLVNNAGLAGARGLTRDGIARPATTSRPRAASIMIDANRRSRACSRATRISRVRSGSGAQPGPGLPL